MKRIALLILAALMLLACSSAPEPESTARSEQPLTCYGPSGSHATGLTALPQTVQRAHFLVNKMWGTWPKPPTYCPPGYCPGSCASVSACQSGQCLGWSCQATQINYASDGLRLCTLVGGDSMVDAKFAQQPDANGLTGLETTELGTVRLTAGLVDDYWCAPW
jgi:hypothetical protein